MWEKVLRFKKESEVWNEKREKRTMVYVLFFLVFFLPLKEIKKGILVEIFECFVVAVVVFVLLLSNALFRFNWGFFSS